MLKLMIYLIFCCSAAQATVIYNLFPEADSYTYSFWIYGDDDPDYADDNFGAEPELRVLNVLASWCEVRQYTFIRFPLHVVDPPDNYELSSAVLRFHALDNSCSTIEIGKVYGHWEETQITWNNQPGAVHLKDTDVVLGWNEVELDPGVIGEMIDDPSQNHGLRLHDPTYKPNWQSGIFESRETSNPPELVLTYSYSSIEETSWGLIKAQP